MEGDGGDLGGQGEDDVEVGRGQQVGLAFGQPDPAAEPWHLGQWRLRHEL
jgi:hypothetical protein